jgi:hypothetical protein
MSLHKLAAQIKMRKGRADEPLGIVVSFPKSGRTWLRVMFDRLSIPVLWTHDTSSHVEALHYSKMAPAGPIYRDFKVIFLARDPRDTVVSGYFQTTRRLANYAGDISAFIRDPHHGIEKIIVFNLMWISAANARADRVVMSYEELHADTVGAVTRAVSFLAVSRPSEAIALTVQECAFHKMQRAEREGDFAKRFAAQLGPPKTEDPEALKIRRGQIGVFHEYLSEEDVAYCDDILRKYDYHAAMQRMSIPTAAQISPRPNLP